MRITSISVPEGFPLASGEVLRIHYPGTRKETRIKVLPGETKQGNKIVFSCKSKLHDVGTNKESISVEGNERKLRRV